MYAPHAPHSLPPPRSAPCTGRRASPLAHLPPFLSLSLSPPLLSFASSLFPLPVSPFDCPSTRKIGWHRGPILAEREPTLLRPNALFTSLFSPSLSLTLPPSYRMPLSHRSLAPPPGTLLSKGMVEQTDVASIQATEEMEGRLETLKGVVEILHFLIMATELQLLMHVVEVGEGLVEVGEDKMKGINDITKGVDDITAGGE